MKKSIAELEEQRQKESIVFQNKMDYVLYYLLNSFGLGGKPLLFNQKIPDQLKLPKLVNVSKERFNEILSTVTKAKNGGLKINVDGRKITLDNVERLPKGIASRKINRSEFKRECNNIFDDAGAILQRPMLTRSQDNMVKFHYWQKFQKLSIKKQTNNQTLLICMNQKVKNLLSETESKKD